MTRSPTSSSELGAVQAITAPYSGAAHVRVSDRFVPNELGQRLAQHGLVLSTLGQETTAEYDFRHMDGA